MARKKQPSNQKIILTFSDDFVVMESECNTEVTISVVMDGKTRDVLIPAMGTVKKNKEFFD